MNENITLENKKVLFCDLDGTIIETISGETFPKGIWDMEFRFDVLDAIKKMRPLAVLIATNQGGVEKGFVGIKDFERKMEYIKCALRQYVGVFTEYIYCTCNDVDYYYRKPNTGMLDNLFLNIQTNWFRHDGITKEDCIMIGDASGKEGQFSDSDKRTAENFGIDYMDVNEFINAVL